MVVEDASNPQIKNTGEHESVLEVKKSRIHSSGIFLTD